MDGRILACCAQRAQNPSPKINRSTHSHPFTIGGTAIATPRIPYNRYEREARKHRLNREIDAREVRLIGEDNEFLGVSSIAEALRQAEERGTDLVEIAANAEPPVCRLMDYGKFKFQEQKKEQLSRSRQKIVETKEVKFRPVTGPEDYQVKLRNVRRFLGEGDKARITIRFRGREMTHQELGMALLERIRTDLDEVALVEHMPKLEGRQLVMVIAPKKKATGKKEDTETVAPAKAAKTTKAPATSAAPATTPAPASAPAPA